MDIEGGIHTDPHAQTRWHSVGIFTVFLAMSAGALLLVCHTVGLVYRLFIGRNKTGADPEPDTEHTWEEPASAEDPSAEFRHRSTAGRNVKKE